MNEKLKSFLDAEDLDDLMSFRGKLGVLDEEDFTVIRGILRDWNNPQAVANLLFHPRVIPEDIRLSSILRGLYDRINPYNVLAATVGLQAIDPQQLSDNEIDKIRDRLFDLIEQDETIVAARASVSILPFLSALDVDRVYLLLSHPQDTTRLNLLGWLLKTVDPKTVDEFIGTLNVHNVPPETQAQVSEKLQKHFESLAAGKFSIVTAPLYAYIPNLGEM